MAAVLASRGDEILHLAAEGWTDKQIAHRLFISPRTVEGHWRRLREKTGQPNRAGVIGFVLRTKLAEAEQNKPEPTLPPHQSQGPQPSPLTRLQEELTKLYREINALKEENESLKNLSSLVAQSNLFAYRLSLATPYQCLFVTETVRLFGYEPEDFLQGGVPISALIHPADFDRVWASLLDQIETQAPTREVTYRLVTVRGDVRHVVERSVLEPGSGSIAAMAFDVSHMAGPSSAQDKVELL